MSASIKMPESEHDTDHKYAGTASLAMIEEALVNYNEWIIKKFVQALPAAQGRRLRVLDFGTGLGTLSKLFQRYTGIKPDALDIDPDHRAEAIKNGFTTFARLNDLTDTYDLVFLSNVLEHIEDDVGVLKAIRPHMRDNGILLIYVPAFKILWTVMDDMVEHVRRYRIEDLSRKIHEAGYDIVSTRYCDSMGFALSLLFKFVGKKSGEMPYKSLRFYDRYLLPFSKLGDLAFSRFFGKNIYLIARNRG